MAQAQRKEGEQEITLYSLARDALRDADGDAEKAIRRLTTRLRKDQALLSAIISSVIYSAVHEKVTHSTRVERAKIIEIHSNASRFSVGALASTVSASFLGMHLSPGLLLGDATEADLRAKAEEHSAHARDRAHKSRWYNLIADNIAGTGKKVREVLADDLIGDLYEKTRLSNEAV